MIKIHSKYEIGIGSDYALATAALADMGWDNPVAAGVPAQETIERGINASPLAGWLIERAGLGIADTLVIAPRVGGKNGIGVASLIARHNLRASEDGFVWSSLWGQADGSNNPYGDRAVVHDNAGEKGLQGMWDVAMLLGDTVDPASGNEAYGNGLVFTEITVAEQRELAAKEAKELEKRGITVVTATAGAMAVDSSALRLLGVNQRAGVTRLINYPDEQVRDCSCVPGVDWSGDRLRWSGASVSSGWSVCIGVRRLARVALPLET